MGATIYEVNHKGIGYPELDFYDTNFRVKFWEMLIDAFEYASGERGTYVYLPPKEQALNEASGDRNSFPEWAVNKLEKFGDKYGWNKDYFIG